MVFLQGSWPKLVVRKLLNIRSGADEFHSDCAVTGKISVISDDHRNSYLMHYELRRRFIDRVVKSGMMDKVERRRKSCSDQGSHVVVPEDFAGRLFFLAPLF